jgi:hypothetical protein
MTTGAPYSNLLQSGSEAELCHSFMVCLGTSLTDVFNGSVRTCPFSLSPFAVGQALRTADFVCFRNYSIAMQGMNSPCDPKYNHLLKQIIYLVGETKRHNFAPSPGLLDLVERYQKGETHEMDAIHQLCGYHVKFNCKFGVLSTYEYTWATFLTESGHLFISPAFCQDDEGPLSTMNMMRYLICTAADEVNSGTEWKLPQDLQSIELTAHQQEVKRSKLVTKNLAKAAKEAAKAMNLNATKAKMALRRGGHKKPPHLGGAKTALSRGRANKDRPRGGGYEQNRCVLKIIRTMVDHEDRITWQGRMEDSKGLCSLVAIKCYADRCTRDFEVACYDALSPLQGQCIPTLINRKLHSRCDVERRHGLVLSWVGEADNGNYMTLPTRVLQRARELVESMHRLGVSHGDARPENMNYDFKTDKLFIYDFSHARIRLAPEDPAFDRACKDDLKSLDMEIEWSMTDAGRAIQYLP